MTSRQLVRIALASVLMIAAFLGSACVAGQTAAPFDMKATLDKYLSGLPDNWGLLTPAEMKEQVSTSVFVFDVRETKEMADFGYIEGSVNIPIRSLIKSLDRLPAKDKPIIVTCSSGHRSALAMEALQLLGYTNVKSLAGGIGAWKAANLPFVTGTPPKAKVGQMPDVDQELLGGLDAYFSSLPGDWGMIAPSALKDLVTFSRPFQLEVRDAREVAESGTIAGASSIPIRSLVKNLDKLPPDKGAPVIAECNNGHRSAMAMMALTLLGYTNVRSLAGGLSAWAKAGLPVSK